MIQKSKSASWVEVWRGPAEFEAHLKFQKLRAQGLHPILLNLRESAYRTSGDYVILVHVEESSQALALLYGENQDVHPDETKFS